MRANFWQQALWVTALLAFWDLSHNGFSTAKLLGLMLFSIATLATGYIPGKIPLPLPLTMLIVVCYPKGEHSLDLLGGLACWIVFICVYAARPKFEDLRLATLVAGSLCGLGVILTLLHPAFSFGGMGNPNFAAHFMLATLAIQDPKSWRPHHYGLFAMLLIGLVLTQSRAGYLGFFICAYLFTPGAKRWLLLAFAALGLSIAAWFWRADVQQFAQYASEPQRYVAAYRQQPPLLVDRDPWFKGKRLSLMNRVVLYGNTLHGIGDHPWLGHGWNQFRVAYPQYNGRFAADVLLDGDYRVHAAHSFPLRIGFELGLIGVGIFGFLIVQLYRKGSPALRRLLIVQLSLSLVAVNDTNLAIWAILALAAPAVPSVRWWDSYPAIGTAMAIGLLIVYVDIRREAATHAESIAEIPAWLPEERARLHYAQGDFAAAWRAQEEALAQDPHGPELLVNQAHIAWMRSQSEASATEAEAWRNLAEQLYRHIAETYPDVRFVRP